MFFLAVKNYIQKTKNADIDVTEFTLPSAVSFSLINYLLFSFIFFIYIKINNKSLERTSNLTFAKFIKIYLSKFWDISIKC